MKILYSTLLSLILIYGSVTIGKAQSVIWEWATSMGGPRPENPTGIAVNDSGYIYSCGTFRDHGDFDPGSGIKTLSSVGEEDVYVSKLDNSGNYVWAHSFGGSSVESVADMDIDGYGNIYLTGTFSQTCD